MTYRLAGWRVTGPGASGVGPVSDTVTTLGGEWSWTRRNEVGARGYDGTSGVGPMGVENWVTRVPRVVIYDGGFRVQ